jgi:hypothetical protein
MYRTSTEQQLVQVYANNEGKTRVKRSNIKRIGETSDEKEDPIGINTDRKPQAVGSDLISA